MEDCKELLKELTIKEDDSLKRIRRDLYYKCFMHVLNLLIGLMIGYLLGVYHIFKLI